MQILWTEQISTCIDLFSSESSELLAEPNHFWLELVAYANARQHQDRAQAMPPWLHAAAADGRGPGSHLVAYTKFLE